MRLPLWLPSVALILLLPAVSLSQDSQPSYAFSDYIRRQAAELRANDQPPATLAEWEKRRAALRRSMQEAWGEFPSNDCPLEPRIVGTLSRDGYRVEKVVFQTRPGIWMTANAYVPDRTEKLPAVLCVHGHWRGAKQDPTVQARCIGLAKLGFFVLVVDAFGAGERGLSKALGEYHGEMVAATLLPVGLPLSGLQVYENMRAVDYLLTRPEVDGARLGITGASGGGNQTMYAGGWDDRLAAVVPVCSVGNYQIYLHAACCMCEVVPGALRFTEEAGVLGLSAPRSLMLISATKDAIQFSVGEARKSLDAVRPVFALHGREDNLKHAIFESPHDYNRAMRETMYGWMTRSLTELGEAEPITEPEIEPEDPETLRCFPGQSRPDAFVTIPQFAAAEAKKILAKRLAPTDSAEWKTQRAAILAGLKKVLFGRDPPPATSKALVAVETTAEYRTISLEPEPGLRLVARQVPPNPPGKKLALLLDLDGREQAAGSDLAAELGRDGWSVLTLDLRATGKLAYARDKIGRAPDHTTAEWSLWLGRPLLGQWVVDVRRLVDALKEADGKLPDTILAAGVGPAGLVAVCSAALDRRITQVATAGMMASYVTEEPYQGQRLGIMVPGILRDAGDVAHLAALVAPRRLLLAGGVDGGGRPLATADLNDRFSFTRRSYDLAQAADKLRILPGADVAGMVKELR